jgi:hypothetical protein
MAKIKELSRRSLVKDDVSSSKSSKQDITLPAKET